jgi:hypothetical protein
MGPAAWGSVRYAWSDRWSDRREVAEAPAARRELRTGLDVRITTGVFGAMFSAELYRLLVAEKAWSELGHPMIGTGGLVLHDGELASGRYQW